MARRLDDRRTLLYALPFAATVSLLVPDAQRFGFIEGTVELATALDERLVLLQALPGYITALLARGEQPWLGSAVGLRRGRDLHGQGHTAGLVPAYVPGQAPAMP